MIPGCGGCDNLGAHTRWCPQFVGRVASIRAHQAARAENLADEVGANCPQAANALYHAAGLLLEQARLAKQQHQAKETP